MISRKDYISDSEWNKFLNFSKELETPNIVINLKKIKANFLELKDSFPFAKIYYAVKSNPGEPILNMLNEAGSCFDIASRFELDKLPLSLKSGDRLYWLSTGAYTSTYASVEFNGFPPLKTYYME